MPINPKLLEWARKRAAFTVEEAAQKFSRFAEWEAGTASPTYSQLERVANELRVPIAVFFFPEPPKEPVIRESFRTLPEAEFDSMPRRITHLLRKAKAFQLNLSELMQGGNRSSRLITRDLQFPDDIALDTMVACVRSYLEITLIEQYAWSSDDDALKAWRKALQNAGIFVFKDTFKTQNYSGFSLYDDIFPIIFVNNGSAKTRQIFTLFHELAHLLFHTSGIDKMDDDYIADLSAHQKRVEILCNQFAASFLVPLGAFNDAMAYQDHSEQVAETLAARFHVSREVIFRMFLDRDWITQTEYRQVARRWADQQRAGGSGGNHYWTKIAYLGNEYISLAFSQYYQHRIDDLQLADYLDTKPRNLSALEEYFAKAPP